MLTEAEKKWLEGKSEADYPAPCVRTGKRGLFDMRYCLMACEGNSASSPKYCPIASDYRDAAEFEARVSAWMADNLPSCDFCNWYAECFDTSCARTRLKHARLAVEQEMECE